MKLKVIVIYWSKFLINLVFKRKNPVRMTKIARKSDKLLFNIKEFKRNRHLKIEISKEFHFKRKNPIRRTKIERKFGKLLLNIKKIKRTRHLIIEIS